MRLLRRSENIKLDVLGNALGKRFYEVLWSVRIARIRRRLLEGDGLVLPLVSFSAAERTRWGRHGWADARSPVCLYVLPKVWVVYSSLGN